MCIRDSYYGSRHNSVDHLQTALKNGFAYAVTDAPIIIADGICGNNWVPVKVGLNYFNVVKIAGDIENSDSMIVLSHFKGHGMSGFGGAIKNLAMGCAAAVSYTHLDVYKRQQLFSCIYSKFV